MDDGSDTPLDGVVAPYHARFDATLLRQANAGAATARNNGAARAKGQLLAFSDDDCEPASTWLKTLAECFAIVPDHAFVGRTVNKLSKNTYSTASQLLVDYLFNYYNAPWASAGSVSFITGNNLSLPADRYRALGGFDASFPHVGGEDREFCTRLLKHGYPLTYAPEAVVYHAHAMTVRSYWGQHFDYGRGAFRYHRVRAHQGWAPLKVEPVAFYLNMLRYPFSKVPAQRATSD